MISDGKTHEEAFSLLTERIEKVFKIHLKGYIALTTESFVRFVDGLGGIKIQIDEDFPYVEDFRKIGVNLVIGENVLLGNSALKFVRHRATYLGGDLTRLDVQKVFFSGMFATIYRFVTDEGVRRLYSNIKENLSSDFSIIDIILMVIKHSSKFKTVEFVYFTLPGKAYLSPGGLCYYQINKPGLQEVRATYLNAEIAFESGENLVISKEIYLNENIDYKVFYSKAVTENQEE
jgi:LCP family protein required for cell wall assembly